MTERMSNGEEERRAAWAVFFGVSQADASGGSSLSRRPNRAAGQAVPTDIEQLHHRASLLQNEQATTYQQGQVVKTAAVLALEQGEPLSKVQIMVATNLSNQLVTSGINSLLDNELAIREIPGRHRAHLIRASAALLFAAANPTEYPLLQDAMQAITQPPKG